MSSDYQIRKMGRINKIGLYTIIMREIRRFLTVPLQALFAPVTTIILFYTIFALAFDGKERMVGDTPFLQFLACGLIIMSMIQNAFVNTSSSLIIAKIQKNIVDILMPPLTSAELLTGLLTGGIIRGLMIGCIAVPTMMLIAGIPVHNLFIILLFAILGTTMLSAIGIIGGLMADKFDEVAGVTNFVITPLAFLSGTFYSVTILPPLWQKLALFNPFFYIIDGFRSGFTGIADGNIMIGAGYLLTIDLVLCLVLLRMLETGYKTKS